MTGRRLRHFGTTLVVVVGIAVIAVLATGQVALVSTYGVSMEPRFHTGDLAVIVPAAPYHVGEVVGYNSPLLHVIVLHRIVAEHSGLFTFKGDNNDFLDPRALPSSAIKGRLWIRVPHGGTVLGWVGSPIGLGLLAFVFVACSLGGASRRKKNRGAPAGHPGQLARAGTLRNSPGMTMKPAVHSTASAGNRRIGMPVGWWPASVPLVMAGVFGLMAIVAWSRPLTQPSESTLGYDQHFTYSYAALAPVGVTYPTGLVSTGDPVFIHLVNTLDVTARYSFDVTTPGTPSGTRTALTGLISVAATLRGPGGWSGQLASTAPAAFSGTTASIKVAMDLSRVPTLEKEFTAETGMSLGTVDIAVTAMVYIRGSVDGAAVTSTFAPPLSLQISGQELSLPSASPSEVAPSFPQLTPDHSGSVERSTRVVAHMTILGRSFTVGGARNMSRALVAVSELAAIFGFAWILRRRKMDETSRIRAAYGYELITVTSSPTTHSQRTVDVDSFATLGRLARRYDCVILEFSSTGGRSYYVECGATLYRWRADSTPVSSPGGADDMDQTSIPVTPSARTAAGHRWRPMSGIPDTPHPDRLFDPSDIS